MPHAARKLRRLARASDDEALRDILAEVRYALTFAALGFAATCEPTGDERGPDFAVARADASFALEVHRFRPVSIQLTGELEPDGTLSEYGRGQQDVRRALYVIFEKFAQLGSDPGVVALWSDDDGIEELEVGLAVAELREEARRGQRAIPPNVSLVLFGSADVSRSGQQFYCYDLRHSALPRWRSEIERARARV